jgi:hypothetical protein
LASFTGGGRSASGNPCHATGRRNRSIAAVPTDVVVGAVASRGVALGDDDIEDGDVNPIYDKPWRLLIRLAVGEAAKLALRRLRGGPNARTGFRRTWRRPR